MKPTILAFIRYYLPGYKSGGPVRSVANLVEHLGDEFQFQIVTSDRDTRETVPYPTVVPDAWNDLGNSRVSYASSRSLSFRAFSRLMANTPHDVLYLNSFFDPTFTLLPLLARRMRQKAGSSLVVAPRVNKECEI